jgi:hypothetical protein
MWTLVMAVVLGATVLANAQPIIQNRTIDVVKSPVHAATGDLMTVSVVTLHFHDAPLREVLATFAKQIDAGVTVESTNDGSGPAPPLEWLDSTRISVNVSRADYWDALAAVVKAMPVRLDPQSFPRELLFVEHRDSGWEGSAEQRGLLAMMSSPGARRVGALLFAPGIVNTGRVIQPGNRLLVRVAAEPRVTGASALAVLRLDSLTAADGRSLLGEQREFKTDEENFGSGDGWARWLFDMGEAPADVTGVEGIRGELRVAVGSEQRGKLPLLDMFHPVPPVPGEVQTNVACEIFRAPDFADTRSADTKFVNECRVEGVQHSVPKLEGPPERSFVSYSDARILVLHNMSEAPETFVVWTGVLPDQVRYTSNQKPLKVQGHAEYRVDVAPGATERLHIAYEVNRKIERLHLDVPDVPLAPEKLWQQVTIGKVRLVVKAVVPQAGEYIVRGEFSSAADGPVKYACPYHCQWLGTNDADGRLVLWQAAFAPVQRVNGRDVMEWSLTTEGRGLVPAKLQWRIDGVTRWVKVAVK